MFAIFPRVHPHGVVSVLESVVVIGERAPQANAGALFEYARQGGTHRTSPHQPNPYRVPCQDHQQGGCSVEGLVV